MYLEIHDFEVGVSLGCSNEEQSLIQPVSFNIYVEFANQCLGFQSDQLDQAIDYVQVTKIVETTSKQKSFNLIEHLCMSVHQEIEKEIQKQGFKCRLVTEVTKLRPPVFNLRGGVKAKCQSQF